jgi:glycosyltransferase involved in cell wall biosynthesis
MPTRAPDLKSRRRLSSAGGCAGRAYLRDEASRPDRPCRRGATCRIAAVRPLRIAVVSTYFHPVVGGCETHARQVAHYLATHGCEVVVLTRRTPPDAPREDEDRGVPVRRLPPGGARRGIGKWLLIVPMFLALWNRRRWIDLIYCVDLRGLALAAWSAGRLSGRPVVLQAETPGAISLRNWEAAARRTGIPGLALVLRPVAWLLGRVYGSADAYTCIARQFLEEGVGIGIPRERLHYIPHAVDIDRFRPATVTERTAARERLGLPADRPIVMFLGRLGVEKGVLDLLEAWRLVTHPSAVLAVVGPDMEGHHLDAGPAARAFVAREGLVSRVRFLGGTHDPAATLWAADLFVQPSHYEAFGISLIEAMATGLPVVASGVGGMQDYLVDGENAVISGAHAPQRLARDIDRLLRDDGWRARLGAASRRTIEERFTEDAIGQSYAALFEGLVSAPAAP